jgi:hypothetical protein
LKHYIKGVKIMGIFGIKTRKEKEAEAAKLRAAKREEEILALIGAVRG